ncbi:MAG: cell division protein FtsI, partial [Lachnospiraceae bacterium]|nr:cell division protein FtsI [Lachnospiraceae bacterium]
GTAETVPRDNGEFVVSFMCHAPADHPEIICYVVVDRPNVREQDDAKYSSIISRQILTEILPYLNIPMTEEVSDKEREELLALELSIYTNRVEQEDAEADASANNPEGEQ